MKKIAIIVVLAFCFLSLNAQCPYYYWYNNEKICVERYNKMRYILVDEEEDTFIVKEKLEKLGYMVSDFKKTIPFDIYPYQQEPIEEKYWTMIESNNVEDSAILNIDEISYEAFSFLSFSHFIVGLSHRFTVSVHTLSDTITLDSMARAYRVVILGNSKTWPHLFRLSCSKASAGNSMEMANLFYESGFFQYSEPDLMFDIKTLSANEEYFSNQWNLKNMECNKW